MTLTAGAHIGPYEILSPAGAGGMGEVYRATDTRLRREVAIKICAERFSDRFEREARAIASLNHPNICQLYDVGPNYLVMELIEGPTLADRIARGPIPVDEALAIARQIAEALEAAHEKGIVHRDLKPANIKVTTDGAVKVFDFGLAKAAEESGAADDPNNSPTLIHSQTQAGIILGTAGYMSPEQAAGRPTDKRADIWSFGVVLYEMLTGRTLFEGETTSHILADVLRGPIDLDKLPADTPAGIRMLLARCLDRSPRTRLRDIGEARVAIQNGKEPAAPAAGLPARRTWWIWPAATAVLLVSTLLLLVRGWKSSEPAAGATAVRATLELTPADSLANNSFGRPHNTAMTFSPDGKVLVFAGASGSGTQLYKRALDQPEAVPIPGTAGGHGPFFSPDGQFIGFYADGELKKVPTSGGPAVPICELGTGLKWGATWGADDNIAFSDGSLKQVSAQGGEAKMLLQADASRRMRYASPEFLPDGKTLLFAVVPRTNWEDAEIDILPAGGKPRRLIKGGADPRYVAAGYLVYLSNGALLAAPFDDHRLQLTAPPAPILDGVMQSVNAPNGSIESGIGQFAISRLGALVYASGGIYPPVRGSLVRMDRKGAITDLKIKGAILGIRLSPDGMSAAGFRVTTTTSRATDVELYDLQRGTSTRLTDSATWPVWSPDGHRIAVSAGGKIELIRVGGQSGSEVIPNAFGNPASWSRDGKWLAWLSQGPFPQIWIRPMTEQAQPRRLSNSTSGEYDAGFSPDGKWIAYSSNESGDREVYVQAFPGPGEEYRISTAGGVNCAWAPNGRELFYIGPIQSGKDGQAVGAEMMAVDIDTRAGFRAGAPHVLFTFPKNVDVTSGPNRSYDVYPDGQHFLVALHEHPLTVPVARLRLILNWFDELKRRAPARK